MQELNNEYSNKHLTLLVTVFQGDQGFPGIRGETGEPGLSGDDVSTIRLT